MHLKVVLDLLTLRDITSHAFTDYHNYWGCGCWYPMMGYGDGYGGLFMMILWTVFLILIAVFIYALIKGKTTGMWGSPVVETPVEILKKRYAKGEITKDQFEQMKKDIQT